LGLAGALTGHVALDIVFLLGNELLLGAILFQMPFVALGALLDVVAIIAGVDL
jgi:hypothetical protein